MPRCCYWLSNLEVYFCTMEVPHSGADIDCTIYRVPASGLKFTPLFPPHNGCRQAGTPHRQAECGVAHHLRCFLRSPPAPPELYPNVAAVAKKIQHIDFPQAIQNASHASGRSPSKFDFWASRELQCAAASASQCSNFRLRRVIKFNTVQRQIYSIFLCPRRVISLKRLIFTQRDILDLSSPQAHFLAKTRLCQDEFHPLFRFNFFEKFPLEANVAPTCGFQAGKRPFSHVDNRKNLPAGRDQTRRARGREFLLILGAREKL
ncbi:hypothetical protein C8R43DRAFT_1109013 [Mycena crocata]|nr:hypothetical protein C8R43DRAFT_1109013 [Mycena crocata]